MSDRQHRLVFGAGLVFALLPIYMLWVWHSAGASKSPSSEEIESTRFGWFGYFETGWVRERIMDGADPLHGGMGILHSDWSEWKAFSSFQAGPFAATVLATLAILFSLAAWAHWLFGSSQEVNTSFSSILR